MLGSGWGDDGRALRPGTESLAAVSAVSRREGGGASGERTTLPLVALRRAHVAGRRSTLLSRSAAAWRQDCDDGVMGQGRDDGGRGYGREAPTAEQLLRELVGLPPERAAAILATVRPAPALPPPEDGTSAPPPVYGSWAEFLHRTTPAERRRWCAAKAGKANGERLMSGVPATTISAEDVLTILIAAEGRCAHCGSLAVERRPSGPNGAPLPWAGVGRRIGSLGHVVSRFHGGANARSTWPGPVCGATPGRASARRARPTTAPSGRRPPQRVRADAALTGARTERR
jgi:hypothetical protein